MVPHKKVLVVEDDVSIRILLGTLLSHDGYACEFSADGDDAVRRLRDSEYDAILLDLMLPGQLGFDVIDFLASERPAMAPRVIVLTAASQAMLQNFDSTGIHVVMRKPFDINQLRDHVRDCTSSD
ncbi:MAG TPA: response regulator [Thermoanaerobaculia bacterium]|jgi:DNA-binding response OmpR family regulator